MMGNLEVIKYQEEEEELAQMDKSKRNIGIQ
jgi:hypothetical protein